MINTTAVPASSSLASATPVNFKMNRSVKNNFGKSILAGLLALNFFAVSALAAAPIGGIPFYFEENRGQANAPAQFIARGRNYQFLISPDETQIVLQKSGAARAVEMQFIGANPQARTSGDGELSGKINYLIGSDSAQWHTGVATFSKIRVEEIYPGVNLIYYGNQQQLEYDFTIAPETNPNVIAIHFSGADKISVNARGELILALGKDEIRQPAPLVYQIAGGERKEISGGYKILDAQTVAFAVGKYNHALPLVIDPVLSYSTYFGGNSGDTASSVAVDTNGFIYVAGQTLSSQFAANTPLSTPGAFQTNYQGGTQAGDAFVAKFSNDGANLVYFTYLGGSADDAAYGIAVDSSGDVYVAGATESANFPVKNGIYTNISGTVNGHVGLYPADAFVAELNPGGSNLVYSTYLGGGSSDAAYGVAVDSSGNAYLTGFTYSTNFPVTNAIQNYLACPYTYFNANAFVAKIGAGGSPLIYSTYFGGTNYDVGRSIAVDSAGDACVTGFTDSTNFPTTTNAPFQFLNGLTNGSFAQDAFVAKFAPSGTNLIYSTFLGGANDDAGYHIACDDAGSVYVTGSSDSTNFPDTATNVSGLFSFVATNASGVVSATNAFLTKIDAGGAIVYSALFGGYAGDIGYGVAVDPNGNAFVTGATTSMNFPTANAFGLLCATNSGGNDVFVTAFNTNCSALLYSAYLGGSGDDFGYGIAADPLGNAYVVGQTASANFPTLDAGQTALNGASDAFVAKIVLTVPPPEITTQPTNQTAGVESTVTFDVTVSGTPPLSYQWQLNGTNLANGASISGATIGGVTNATLTINGVQTNDSGNYLVIVTNYGGSVTSSVVVLTVTSVPFLTLQPTNQTVGVGSTVSFYVDGYATQPYFLQWLKDGTDLTDGTNSSGSIISGSTGDPLTIISAQTNDDGNYQFVVTNNWGSATSAVATLTVLTSPGFTTITTASGSGDSFILSGVGGTNDGTYFVLTSTNLVTPLALWTPIATNQFGDQGQFIFTNTAPSNTPQLFYILQMQSP
jgi:hypothetical protein